MKSTEKQNISFIGFGEAAMTFVKDWAGAGGSDLKAYDIKTESPSKAVRQNKHRDYDQFGVKGCKSLNNARSWTDHLLWHHACHTVDLFQYQTGELISKVYGLQGPRHDVLGISMDMNIIMKVPSGAICTLSLSFNNDGPLGTFFRYIGDNGTYLARYDDLLDGYEKPIDLTGVAVSNNGIELQDREFFAAIREGREPNASVAQCLPAMKILDQVERGFK